MARRHGILVLAAFAVAVGLTSPGGRDVARAASRCPAPAAPLTFSLPKYVDPDRAGGEPTIVTHPDGTLLVGTHAGTTHVFVPGAVDSGAANGAFVDHYDGRTYYFWSGDNGTTWHFVDRGVPPTGLPASGFSDPDFAIDAAGDVFISEINLANISISRSADVGRSYVLKNPLAQTLTDRQWSEADLKDIVYMTGNAEGGGTSTQPVGEFGHTIYRSVDGGATFTPGAADPGGTGDLKIDRRNGTLYEANLTGGRLGMAAFRRARSGDLVRDVTTVATGVQLTGAQWPAFDIDAAGNLYLTWSETGDGNSPRSAGIWYSASSDGARHWNAPVRVDTDDRTDLWPWIAVGDPGRVAIAWFQADVELPGNDAQTPGTYGWRVAVAQTLTGLGCSASPTPGFAVSIATPTPFHTGTICTGGTACEAQQIDRRLGDYFEIAIDKTGRLWGAYGDTRRGGIVGLAAFVRQTGGPLFTAPPAVRPGSPPASRQLPRTLSG